ncbi:low molecular weight protein-tyrosine-phosphatase [Calditerricola satsumensis]|uniref:protein-tyrosine-phosphatase n=1 Tax=Calditerricola satsumensis TaxID=373054 RepID=A0A8J3FAB4_9BACI|nr:low molecular weight protein-tyrosine-phosphatase [Calditerricola satsumensis]GGJ96498.1 low molecular weight protein-tyrosine-phosphatase YfkJ [Calditerricola satsumensis]
MIRVLFVCLGNICRSPMAEAVFRHMVKEAGLDGVVEVDSAGTGHWHVGEPPHEGTRRILEQKGIDWRGIRARQVAPVDAERFDYIVAMDAENQGEVVRMLGLHRPDGKKRPQVFRLLELVPDAPTADVPDPYYTGNFDEVYELIRAGCAALLERIRRDLEKRQAGEDDAADDRR